VAALGDRLDYIVGAKAANPLDEVFGIRTVDDLLRHYPRSYVEGTTVRGIDDDRPPEGEHVTLVDEITGQ
jgi:ATP-dependent DNA helicase RecG